MRQEALGQSASSGLGMSTLLSRGLAEWCRVMQIAPLPPAIPVPHNEVLLKGDVMPRDTKSEIVRVLANMVLTLEQGKRCTNSRVE